MATFVEICESIARVAQSEQVRSGAETVDPNA